MSSGPSSITTESFDAYYAELQTTALQAVKKSVGLPADITFHKSLDGGLSQDLDEFSARVLALTNSLLTLVATADTGVARKGKLVQSEEDVVDNFHSLVVDSIDQMLERTDASLDAYAGRNQAPAIEVNAAPLKKQATFRGRLDPAIQHASHLAKPQLLFKTKPDNNNETLWYPALTHKFNAKVPLGHVYNDSDPGNHPYLHEIKNVAYPGCMFQASEPVPAKSFEDTPYSWMSTPEGLSTMMDKLRSAKEIAVDLEYHSYRSFAGFLCLMQISTREEDFIVDTLVLRDELQVLNEVFTDPKIVKVFHGAESDIVWLQQNFSLYIVNLFDTYHASKLLEFPRHGLVNLLEMYCDFTPDKRYQLADWRIRPLPKEMLDYARSDTHFLLFIYDNLRNALLDKAQSRPQSPVPGEAPVDPAHAFVCKALTRSEETASRVFEKEVYDLEGGSGPSGWDTMARKWNKGLLMAGEGVSTVDRAIFKAVHSWRDRVARQDDESTRFVLPNHYIFLLVESPPADLAALLKLFSSQAVPAVLRRRGKELVETIQAAIKEHAATKVGGTIDAPIVVEEPVTSAVVEDVQMEDVPVITIGSGLWSKSTTPTAVVRSSLFGPTAPKMPVASSSSVGTTKSSLFGSSSSSQKSATPSYFDALVAKIHSSLVIAPSAPIASSSSDIVVEEDKIVVDENTSPAPIAERQEMAYVPSTQRKAPEVIVEDSIVVVGQARQKRKRKLPVSGAATTAAPKEDNESAGSASKKQKSTGKGKEKVDEEPEAYDFDSVPNILDQPSLDEDQKVKRRRTKKQPRAGAFENGDFPAPPRAHNEVRSGNQSHTFK